MPGADENKGDAEDGMLCCVQTLAEKLAEGLPIRHGVVVDQIQWGGDGVTVHCQGGEQIQADAVIVAVSLGVLKVIALRTRTCRLQDCLVLTVLGRRVRHQVSHFCRPSHCGQYAHMRLSPTPLTTAACVFAVVRLSLSATS